jgi:DNA (cytosine-5)-methyltransferase 1
MIKYLSLFSGIEAATVAWEPLGWECKAVAEILPYQSSVIKKHYPNLKNLGDVTKINDNDIKALGELDVVIFGSPCQDLSVAGKQQGLNTIKDDTNHSSILFFEGMRVFRLAQKYCGARYLVWENVPGALSSNNGEDFGKILNTMVGVEFNSNRLVWRNEGVCFGRDSMLEWSVLDAQWFGMAQRRRRLFVILDTRDWTNRKPILLESKSLRGDFAPSRETQKIITQEIDGSIDSTIDSDLTTFCYDMQAMGIYGDKNVASTLKGRDYKDATDLIVEKSYTCAIASNIIGRNPETRSGGNSTGYNEDVMYTLTGADHHAVVHSDLKHHVRRLTPIECERLQGFPDNWTLIDDKTTFSKRINALGRSMAVPVIKWIGMQIEKNI